MIGALSPVVSWMLFLSCVAVGAVVYVAIAGGRRYRWIEQQFELETHRFDLPEVRVLPHVYDWQTRGDFE